MCLIVDPNEKRIFVRKHVRKNIKTITCYKILNANEEKTTLQSRLYRKFWKVGINRSNRTNNTKLGTNGDTRSKTHYYVYKGIHVYLNPPPPPFYYPDYTKIVKVKCEIKDLVGINQKRNQAVFTKVRLSREELERALK